jgi:xanthine dehydrogenase YagT iron-sulfur-binding subunit
MKDEDAPKPDRNSGLTRRDFIKISGVGVAVPLAFGPTVIRAAGEDVEVHGPGKVPIALNVNGNKLTAELEPRVTLLDALRDTFNLTGAKRVCDRGTCGACTVLLEGKPVYACMVLAVDAQGKKITTIEDSPRAMPSRLSCRHSLITMRNNADSVRLVSSLLPRIFSSSTLRPRKTISVVV